MLASGIVPAGGVMELWTRSHYSLLQIIDNVWTAAGLNHVCMSDSLTILLEQEPLISRMGIPIAFIAYDYDHSTMHV